MVRLTWPPYFHVTFALLLYAFAPQLGIWAPPSGRGPEPIFRCTVSSRPI